MTMSYDLVFLLDVDNTLLDNDRVQRDLSEHLERAFGRARREEYWEIFEALRVELGYSDYLGGLQRYRLQTKSDPRLLLMSSFLVDYPFAERLYPGALDAIRYLDTLGRTVILSDGDVVFQPRKIQTSGLWDAVDGRVLVYIHKEQMLEAVSRLLSSPALRHGRRQIAHPCGNEDDLGKPADDGVSAAGTLRIGSRQPRRISVGRHHRRTHRRPDRP